nr:MAG TPA: antirepressor [Caudoviricetes sp.]
MDVIADDKKLIEGYLAIVKEMAIKYGVADMDVSRNTAREREPKKQDVAKALGYKNTRKALSDHCKGVTKRYIGVQTGQKADGTPAMQDIEMNFVTEDEFPRNCKTARYKGKGFYWILVKQEIYLPRPKRKIAAIRSICQERFVPIKRML